MDVKAYYEKVRALESQLPEPCVVVSEATEDGGKAGIRTEVSRGRAARLIVSGAARQATADEAAAFQRQQAEAKQVADQLAAASRMQVTVIPSSEWRGPKGSRKD